MPSKKPSDKKNNPFESYARYSGMAIQMLAIIAAGSFGGVKIDKWLNIKFPVFTVILSLAGVTLAIWLLIKEFNNTTNK
jgi:hypothetical protein